MCEDVLSTYFIDELLDCGGGWHCDLKVWEGDRFDIEEDLIFLQQKVFSLFHSFRKCCGDNSLIGNGDERIVEEERE